MPRLKTQTMWQAVIKTHRRDQGNTSEKEAVILDLWRLRVGAWQIVKWDTDVPIHRCLPRSKQGI